MVKPPAWIKQGAADGFVPLGRLQSSFVAGLKERARPWLLARTKVACAERGG